jgi:hypothetical protein
LIHEAAGLNPGGGSLDIKLAQVSRITGRVRASDAVAKPCVPTSTEASGQIAPDGTVPARVTLTPRTRLLGIQAPTHTAATVLQTDPDTGPSNQFTLSVYPGEYDVYVEPLAPDGDCALPPQLFVGKEISPSDVALGLPLTAPQYLDVSVLWPDASNPALDGWTLDIVEQDSGRVLSTEAKLSKPESVDGGLRYHALIAYSPVASAKDNGVLPTGTELVRLAPPEGLTAPIIIVQRNVLELFHEGMGLIDQLELLPVPVKVTGQVSVQDQPEGVAATVTLVATELRAVGAGTVAAFERVVEADSSGQFEVDLLPGTYRVVATPMADKGLATAEAVWEIATGNDVQAGKVVELGPSPVVSADVFDFAGNPVAGMAVQAAASPSSTYLDVDVLDRALGQSSPVVPRAQGTVSQDDGSFEVMCDPGTFDLWVRPESSSGFAWFVRPGVQVEAPGVDLGNVRLPLPVVYHGTLTSGDVAWLSSALVRAYAYLEGAKLTNDPSKATAVIQIAETRTDEQGRFNLLVPASFE